MIDHLRRLEDAALPAFVKEVEARLIAEVVDKIPHLESSLGVAALTVALHRVLNTPEDVLIWDVGHQAYVHKAITGRMEEMATMRTKSGISGFLKREESPYDFFGAGHASTSISALAGVWFSDVHAGRNRQRVAVIGDGSLTGGQSFEALNQLGATSADVVVIINDNQSSIDPTQGALHQRASYAEYVKSLGWSYYFEPLGGDVLAVQSALKDVLAAQGPRVLHVQTQRADLNGPDRYQPGTTFQWFVGEKLVEIFSQDSDIQLISPAMLSGGGLLELQEKFPSRTLDTGINEAHAVTLAAGMAAAGGKPWVHIYSTFLQRAYDSFVHDVALQKLPVVFLVDRAGLVGPDGPTHHGTFDLGFLMDVPHTTVWNPMDGVELMAMMDAARHWAGEGPLVIRYPKAKTSVQKTVEWAPMRWIDQPRSNALFVATGVLSGTVVAGPYDRLHLAQTKPLPEEFIQTLTRYETVIVLEESQGVGGLSGAVAAELARADHGAKLVIRKLPDAFVPHGKRDELLKGLGLQP